MSGHTSNKINYRLNRLMMTEMKDPDKIDPFIVLREFCEFEDQKEMKNLFRQCCQVSLSKKYSWKEGIPGNLLYIYEQFERLIEACFLINTKETFKKRIVKLSKTDKEKIGENRPELPTSISLEEFLNPLNVIHDFFEKYDLMEWKQFIHAWMEAGLSNFSVLESIKTKEVLPYVFGMEKLLDASYRIVFLTTGKEE
jgi:hypothetical protein